MRIFRLIATPLLLLGLVGLLIWGAFWGWQNLTAPLPGPEPTPCVTVTNNGLNVKDVSVRVYNAGFASGLANRVKTRLEDAGFRIVKVDNTDDRVIKGVLLRANEKSQPAIQLVSSYFTDVDVEYDDRVDGTVDVLLASDWGDFGTEPLSTVSSGDEGVICVLPDPSASPASPLPTQP
ncbi:MAG: LytR C-terminal domain-containing protein [Propionibacteriaceae bacterium]|nr:LytR C-terminal domain-containing protein [Propionibacteriaceae bacterium]